MTKIIRDDQLKTIEGNTKILVGGCFDILHEAHREFLQKAKSLGDTLIVLLESDENIKKLKGENRPLNDIARRAFKLSRIGAIDYVVLLAQSTSSEYYYNLVNSIKPDIIAITKGDPLTDVKKDQAAMVGGDVIEVMERNPNHSTTALLEEK
jgi:D-beta-D-heptose 7-phosphate kinase/D-beta-D-heptose 1-phosphate adenosyltransferase